MKTDILKTQWTQIRSGLKANWDRITEDDLDAVGGNGLPSGNPSEKIWVQRRHRRARVP